MALAFALALPLALISADASAMLVAFTVCCLSLGFTLWLTMNGANLTLADLHNTRWEGGRSSSNL